MKEVILPPERIGNKTLVESFELIFSEEVLGKLHGEKFKSSGWFLDKESGQLKRTVQFSMRVDSVPPEVRIFFCGSKLRVTTVQALTKFEDTWKVSNKMRMHFLGAELFVVKPEFDLHFIEGVAHITTRVEHHAVMPSPINHIVEAFMSSQTKRQMKEYMDILKTEISLPRP